MNSIDQGPSSHCLPELPLLQVFLIPALIAYHPAPTNKGEQQYSPNCRAFLDLPSGKWLLWTVSHPRKMHMLKCGPPSETMFGDGVSKAWSATWEESSLLSSVTQSYLTLCNPVDCSMPDFPVHHQLPELAQTHVHQVSDAIQPSQPLSSPSPPAFNPSQHYESPRQNSNPARP